MPEYSKPAPVPDHVTEKFWSAAKDHRLLVQKCGACGNYQFFPQSYCRRCLSQNLDWVQASGTGIIYSFTIIYRPPSPAFEKDVPYIVALVDLDEGIRMMSNIVEIEPQKVRAGMRVEVVFDDINEMIALPKFRPVGV